VIRHARSATKHRISRVQSRYVVEQCGLVFVIEPPPDAPVGASPRRLYLGDDAEGRALEVMAVEMQGGDLLVIHAMVMRAKYQAAYEEAKRWQQ
jgi:hypothetical protein